MNLNSKVENLDNKLTSQMKKLSLSHKATTDKIEEIEALQTAQEKVQTKVSIENSAIIKIFDKEFDIMMEHISGMNKNINDKIEGLDRKLYSHIKACDDKQVVLNVSF